MLCSVWMLKSKNLDKRDRSERNENPKYISLRVTPFLLIFYFRNLNNIKFINLCRFFVLTKFIKKKKRNRFKLANLKIVYWKKLLWNLTINKMFLNWKNVLIGSGLFDCNPLLSRLAFNAHFLELLRQNKPCLEMILLVSNLKAILVLIVLYSQVRSIIDQKLSDFRLVEKGRNHQGRILLVVLYIDFGPAVHQNFNTARVVFESCARIMEWGSALAVSVVHIRFTVSDKNSNDFILVVSSCYWQWSIT